MGEMLIIGKSSGGSAVLPEDIVFCGEEDTESSSAPINADTLGGHPIEDFVLNNDINELANDINEMEASVATLQNSIDNLKFKVLTSSEYESLSTKDSATLYIISD
jgi:hypothetical protein